RVKNNWTRSDLLQQESIFWLRDIAELLSIDSVVIKKAVQVLQNQGKDAWDTIGVRKVFGKWLIRMKTFAPYYRKRFDQSHIRNVDPNWNANDLLGQKGQFFMTEICKLLSLSEYSLRYRVKKVESPKETFGIWKDEVTSRFIVDMVVFSRLFRMWAKSGREADRHT
ncbi:MAG: hypothetical protein QNK37_07755, partial [Acidobacteriota bacterium]|nr:hypothetical protein [Acidobacteriota bacterium]